MSTLWKGVTALLALAILVSLATLYGGSKPIGSENLVGKPLPAFAAPLAEGELDGDANIFTEPQAEAEDATAACDVSLEGSFNSCKQLKGESIIVFWNTTKPECVTQVDRLQEAAAQKPDLSVVAVAFEDTKSEAAAAQSQNRWTIPIAVDRDGAVASLYAVTGCPSVFWAKDQETTVVKLGIQTVDQLLEPFNGATGASN